jgi:hypothetical protein
MAKLARKVNFSFEDKDGDTIEVKARSLSTPELIDYQGTVQSINEKKDLEDFNYASEIIDVMAGHIVNVATSISGIFDEDGNEIDWAKLKDNEKTEILYHLDVDFLSTLVSSYFDKLNELKGLHEKK